MINHVTFEKQHTPSGDEWVTRKKASLIRSYSLTSCPRWVGIRQACTDMVQSWTLPLLQTHKRLASAQQKAADACRWASIPSCCLSQLWCSDSQSHHRYVNTSAFQHKPPMLSSREGLSRPPFSSEEQRRPTERPNAKQTRLLAERCD